MKTVFEHFTIIAYFPAVNRQYFQLFPNLVLSLPLPPLGPPRGQLTRGDEQNQHVYSV